LQPADIVIVGGGVLGASIAHHLSLLRPGRIVLCDQARPPGMGATSRSGGLVRMHHSCPEDVELAAASHETFARWPEVIGGDSGFRRTGFLLLVGPEHRQALGANLVHLSRCGVATSLLDPDDVGELQPGWCLDGIGAAAYEPDSGYAEPRLATLGFLRRACQAGVEVLAGVTVAGVRVERGCATGVETSDGPVAAGLVILAAGAWSARLHGPLGLDVPVACRQIAIAFLDAGASPAACRFTCIDDTLGIYFRPDDGTVMHGVDSGGAEVSPDVETPIVDPWRLAAARDRLARRIPELATAPVVRVQSAFDGYTPDGHGLIGTVPGVDGVYLATAFSGGGFKVAPAVGSAVAREVVDGAEQPLLAAFRPDRFGAGRAVSAARPYTHL